MKKNRKIKILASILCLSMLFSMTACSGNSGDDVANKHLCESRCYICGDCQNDFCDEPACLSKCKCRDESQEERTISYASTDDVWVTDGATDYKVVISQSAGNDELTAVDELNFFMKKIANVTFEVVTDNGIMFDNNAKYISIGKTKIAEQSGFSVPNTLNYRGLAIKRIGKSLFLGGRNTVGTIYAVYELLARTVQLEIFTEDCFDYITASKLNLPDFDFTLQPDIEYMASISGDSNGLSGRRLRYNSASFISPIGGAQWHNSFDYLPPDEYLNSHPDWYATDMKNLCYTCRGNDDQYDQMVNLVVSKMEEAINSTPNGNSLAFTHQDVGSWCNCSACVAEKSKYGTDSAVMLKFINDCVEKVEAWREVAWPERDNIRYLFFAYTACVMAPVYKDAEGKYRPIDESVQPIDKVGVIYAPIASDFIRSKYDPQNSQYHEQALAWSALVGENMYMWFYQQYFYNYFLTYNNFDSMQEDYQEAKEVGCVWMFDQGAYDNASNTGFTKLKAFLEGKLSWDVNADVAKLTDQYMRSMFKDAYAPMRDYFEAMRLHYAYLADYKDMGGWIGNRIETQSYFPINTLLEWEGYFDEAYKAIEKYKTSDTKLYDTLYERITVESLSYRYVLISLYGPLLYSDAELNDTQLKFKEDCDLCGVTKYAEGAIISAFWTRWGI